MCSHLQLRDSVGFTPIFPFKQIKKSNLYLYPIIPFLLLYHSIKSKQHRNVALSFTFEVVSTSFGVLSFTFEVLTTSLGVLSSTFEILSTSFGVLSSTFGVLSTCLNSILLFDDSILQFWSAILYFRSSIHLFKRYPSL